MNDRLLQAEDELKVSALALRDTRAQISSIQQTLKDLEEDHALLIAKRDLLAKRVRREVENHEGAEAAK